MEALGFANPALMWGLLAAGVPLAIHLLSRRRAKRMAFAAMEFVLRSRKQKIVRIRLRQILLLLLRTAVVALVALALARPLLESQRPASAAAGQTAVAVVLDASMSMRYRLKNQSLIDRARSEARSLLDGLPDESPATLVVCDGTPPSAEPPSFDRAALRRRVGQVEATLRSADVTACMAAAARALGESPLEGKRIYVVSDLTVPSLRMDAPAPRVPTSEGEVLPEVVFVDVARGNPLPNLAVVDVSVRSSAALGSRGFEVVATLRNSSDRPAENVPVALRVDGQVVSRGFADVPGAGTAKKVLAHRFEPGTRRVEVVLPEDSLVEDDERPFVLHVPRDVRALVVNGSPSAVRHQDETFFIQAALGPGRIGGRISSVILDLDAAAARSLDDFDVVMLLNVPAPRTAFAAALRRWVEEGGGLFVSLGDQADPDTYNAVLGGVLPRPLHLVRTAAEPGEETGAPPARFGRIDHRHPALAVFEGASEGFDSARIWRYFLLTPDAQGEERVLAAFDDGAPALVEARRGRGRVVLYTSTVDRDWNDWPIRTSFLPAMQQLALYLAGSLEDKPPAVSIVGEQREFEVSEGTEVIKVTAPGGEAAKLEKHSVQIERAGHHVVRVREGEVERDASELTFAAAVDPRESDTRRFSPEELAEHFGGAGRASVAGEASGALPDSGQPLWSWLLLGALLAFVAEGLVASRG